MAVRDERAAGAGRTSSTTTGTSTSGPAGRPVEALGSRGALGAGGRLGGVATPVVCAGLFAALAALVGSASPLVGADHRVLAWVLAHRSGWAVQVATAVTDLGSPALAPAALLVLGGVLSHRRRTWWPLRTAVVAVVVLAVGVLVTKMGLDRTGPPPWAHMARSWTVGDGVDRLSGGAEHGAFPSGHTTTAVVTWTVGARLWPPGRPSRRGRVVVVAVAGTVGLALVYAGYHWASDVVAAWPFGTLLAWIALRVGAPRPGPGWQQAREEHPVTSPQHQEADGGVPIACQGNHC